MPGHRYTQSECALHQVVESFGTLLISLEEQRLTHTYRVVLHFCELENIDCLVLRYLRTGLLPFEEFSEDYLYNGPTPFTFIEETVFGTVTDWSLLLHRCKRLSLRIRRGKKELLR